MSKEGESNIIGYIIISTSPLRFGIKHVVILTLLGALIGGFLGSAVSKTQPSTPEHSNWLLPTADIVLLRFYAHHSQSRASTVLGT
jgi:hypothetical protein